MKRILIITGLFLVLWACNAYKDLPQPTVQKDWKVKEIPSSQQVAAGEPSKGLDYILSGGYIGSGVPYEVLAKRFAKMKDTSILERPTPNDKVPYGITVFEAEPGVLVANGNCFTCHASEFNGEVVLGLGNSFSDFRNSFVNMATLMRLGMKLKYGKKSPEWAAYEDFGNYFTAMAPFIKTNQPGVNPAAHLAEACIAHRDPIDLTYVEAPNYEQPDYTIATDVPPLWNVAKKNALYYTAVGRGDFTKLLFQASVLGIADSTEAREAVQGFRDVVAWLKALEPPKYPKAIDDNLAEKGQVLFEENCSKCHGTYGPTETYPNKVVALSLIKTDPYYATYAVQAPIVDWYNNSWFGTSAPPSWFEPEAGYIAPPLDGVWATAPYLHNGSVPTLDDLLSSGQRPLFWQRSGGSADYDFEKVGWNYKRKDNPSGKWTYDCTIPGYYNTGHTFGDKFSKEERKAVIEYLKTL